ncbi:MAG: hypothetical protein UR94_C0010G0026 [Parcubacteria group bacterium GW2011_GWA2_36_10]|nr:MAG: hypothetical protein UR94_C0010G0026 [Parcubacteria group bacterium GW2011_GWA2_36_10]
MKNFKNYSTEQLKDVAKLIGIFSTVPISLFILALIAVLMFYTEDFFIILPNLIKILIVLIIFFAIIGLSVTIHINRLVTEYIKKPAYISLGLFINAFIYIKFGIGMPTGSGFTEHIDYWWLIALFWIFFPIIETKKVKEYYNQNKIYRALSWMVRFPVYICVFYSLLVLIIIDGNVLFFKIVPFIACLLGLC